MKGTIVKCMQELVSDKFGRAKWNEALKKAGHAEMTVILPTAELKDSDVLDIMRGIGQAASLTADEVVEAFGEYWSSVYAPRVYAAYFRQAKSTKELLLKLDYIHEGITMTMQNARPPRFRYDWESENVLIMHYQSPRGLMNLTPALIRGLGKFFKEKLNVSVSGTRIRVQFA